MIVHWLTVGFDFLPMLLLLLAMLAWSLYLRAVASHLCDSTLRRELTSFAVAFALWSGLRVTEVVVVNLVDRADEVAACIGALVALSALALYLWMLALLDATRLSVSNRTFISADLAALSGHDPT